MKKRRICIIYTGGTIGMVPSERGYIPSSGAFRRLLRAIPDLYWDAMPEWDVVEFDPLLDSSDVAVREWNQMGRAIAERYEAYDGFVVLHGTDTMAYSASALAFMLENLAKPVIFTGAQIHENVEHLVAVRLGRSAPTGATTSSTPCSSRPRAGYMRCASISTDCCCAGAGA